MSATKTRKKSGSPKSAEKKVDKKYEELTKTIEALKSENDELRKKFKLICKKIVDNVDMTDYTFIDINSVEPDQIDINDLLHMVQKLAIMATQISASDNIESHVEALEQRISELSRENSGYFRTKLKLQERLEFIMQERDVWRRNAITLKSMYSKLVKEQEISKSLPTTPRLTSGFGSANSSISSSSNINRCVLGSYRANIDPERPNQRVYSAIVPKDYFEQVREANIDRIQLSRIEHNFSDIHHTVSNIFSSTPAASTQLSLNGFNSSSYSDSSNGGNTESSEYQSRPKHPELIDIEGLMDINSSEIGGGGSSSIGGGGGGSTDSTIEIIDRQQLGTSNGSNSGSKKNVSFNKDIDVRIFRKNSKNSKILESYMLPLPQQHQQQLLLEQQQQQILQEKVNNENIEKLGDENSSKISSLNGNNFVQINKQSGGGFMMNSGDSNSSGRNTSSGSSRGSVCSKRKLPGETPVRELDPTLKMIIIKELSAEKVDGNDWRVFARRIGLNENEIRDWIALKLQYPMARVLSFWSSRPDATVRLLHRHLIAPCFNYAILAKRIENFYDVI